MGLKKMLAQGVANEQEQLNKASKTAEPIAEEVPAVIEPVKVEAPAEVENQTSSEPIPRKKNTGTAIPEKQNKKAKKKNLGGRPTNEEKGIKSRKQYTLTLKEDTYKLILEEAGKEELSFAKFMERAALEYIDNHK